MTTQRNATRRLEEEIANAGALPFGDQVPPLEEGENDDQAPENPPFLTEKDIRSALLQMAQDITTQVQDAMVKTKP